MTQQKTLEEALEELKALYECGEIGLATYTASMELAASIYKAREQPHPSAFATVEEWAADSRERYPGIYAVLEEEARKNSEQNAARQAQLDAFALNYPII